MPRGTLGKVARAGADYRRPTLLASGEINDLDASKLSLTCKPRSAVVGRAAPGSWRMAVSSASRRGDSSARSVLRIQVMDDGQGGADPDVGSGLRGLADRVAGVDGRLRVVSPPGGPTVLTAEVPCD